jgi:drug/metabolite transporter (DMT)-like permease
MDPILAVLLGLLFGIIFSNILHLAKAMEKHGLTILLSKEEGKEDLSFKEKAKKSPIYIIGLILNNTVFVWQFLGVSFSSAAVFSSMFGTGLIILMLYSHYILEEKIIKPELIGAFTIMAGTIMIGVLHIISPPPNENFIYSRFYVVLIVIAITFTALIIFSAKKRIGVAIIFGSIAGTFGGMDNIFKRMSFQEMNFLEIIEGVFTLNPISYIFLFSFIVAGLAFFLTQVGFGLNADASKLVPMYNSFYICAPIFIELIIVENATLSIAKIIAIGIIIVGIFIMNIFKSPEEMPQAQLAEMEMDKDIENVSKIKEK